MLRKKHNVLLYIFILGLYTKHSIELGSISIPFPLCVFSGSVLFLYNLKYMKFRHIRYLFFFLILIFILLILSFKTGFLVEKIKGLIQLIVVLTSSYGFFVELLKFDKKEIGDFFLKSISIILFFSILELYPPIFNISNQLKKLYLNVDDNLLSLQYHRDLIIGGGWPRPHPFAQEVSHVAMFMVIGSSLWYILTENNRKNLFYFTFVFITSVVLRSPIMIFAFLTPIFVTLSYEQDSQKVFRNLMVFFVVSVVISGYVFSLLYTRIVNILQGADNSFLKRIYIPFELLYYSLQSSPFVGAGLMNNEWIINQYTDATNNFSFYYFTIGGNIYILNVIVAYFAYFGIVGGVALIIIFLKYLRQIGVSKRKIIYFFIFVLGLSLGTFSGQMFWGFLFLILGTLIIKERDFINEAKVY